MIECAERLVSGRGWREPAEQVEQWRRHTAPRTPVSRRLSPRLDRLGVQRVDGDREARAAKAETLDGRGLGSDKTAMRTKRATPLS